MSEPQAPSEAPSRLARRLGTSDAVVLGLGAMIGAGVFAVLGPAAEAAGSGLLVALLLAAVVAYCNAMSSARLAALYPESGGTYVYARRRLGRFWGYLAGWGFVVGKLASCAAMALTFGVYAAPSAARPLAVAAVAAVAVVNYRGVRKTVGMTRAIVAVVLASLTAVVVASLFGGEADLDRLTPLWGDGGAYGILQAAGLLFFSFAGYARVATLGEEVRDPAHTIPRAIPTALGITLAVYAIVAIGALTAVGADALASAEAPLRAAVRGGTLDELEPAVRIGAGAACLGVLLSLLAGVSRTIFAMAAERDLPPALDAVHPRFEVPHKAEVAAGVIVGAAVLLVDLRSAIGFSAFTVLAYYAIANASALTLGGTWRGWRAVAVAGLVGCSVLALSLPVGSLVAGALVMGAGAVVFRLRRR